MSLKHSINKLITFIYLGGLVLLLLFSPCKVRNAIQAELGVEKTEIANKILATTQLNNCDTQLDTESDFIRIKDTKAPSNVLILNTSSFAFKNVKTLSNPSNNLSENTKGTYSVPYYILYQNLKIHLS